MIKAHIIIEVEGYYKIFFYLSVVISLKYSLNYIYTIFSFYYLFYVLYYNFYKVINFFKLSIAMLSKAL